MKIAVVGTVMRDMIHAPDGACRESFGGIVYNALALASMVRATDRILPFCHAAREDIDLLSTAYFARRPQFVSDNMVPNPGGTDQSVLRYREGGEREETVTIRTPPLSLDHLKPARDCDALLFNMVSGREVSLEHLHELRRRSTAHFLLDAHNLCRSVGPDGRLVPRRLDDWRDWFSQVDTVQANEWEIENILGARPVTEDEIRQAVLELMTSTNLQAAIITLGARGSVVAHRRTADKSPRVARIPAMATTTATDTTGCGDCYASAFLVGMLRSKNPVKAGLLGAAMSAFNAQGGGLDALIKQRTSSLDESARRAFPDLWRKMEQGWNGEPGT